MGGAMYGHKKYKSAAFFNITIMTKDGYIARGAFHTICECFEWGEKEVPDPNTIKQILIESI